MEITAIMAMVDAAITFLEQGLPEIQRAVERGEVSVEKQKEISDKYNALKQTGFAFKRSTPSK